MPKPPVRSVQVEDLCFADDAYSARYQRCIDDALIHDTDGSLVRDGQRWIGYAQEHTSWRGMRQRVAKLGIPMSPEFNDFRTFLLHVGPKPHYDVGNPLSLDRISARRGYTLGNLRWVGKREQTRNRRTSKFHQVEGRWLSDRELAGLLTLRSGKRVTFDAVKKRRLRGDDTARQFARADLAYESGEKASEDWRFPPTYARIMESLFVSRSHRTETRLDFFVRSLKTKMQELRSFLADRTLEGFERQEAERAMDQYDSDLSGALKEVDRLRRIENARILAPLFEPASATPALVVPTPAVELTEEELAELESQL